MREGANKIPYTEIGEAKFEKLLERLRGLNKTLADKWENDLTEKIDAGEMTISEACEALEKIYKKREEIERYGKIIPLERRNSSSAKIEGGRFGDIMEIKGLIGNPDRFLGNGSVAEVYQLSTDRDNNSEKICVKIVHNLDRYREGNDIHKEGEFLEELSDFTVDDVRTPAFINTVTSPDLIALVMEQLDAACLQRVIEGLDELPDNFDHQTFFKKLKNYFTALHERGIYHLDVATRNIMVDRKTGLPYVIDFGKSQSKMDIIGERFDVFSEKHINKDLAGLEDAKFKSLKYLESKK